MLKKFINFYKPYKNMFFLDMVSALLISVCDLIYPMITRNIINEVIPNKDFKMIVNFAFLLFLIFSIKSCLNYFIQYWGHVIGVRMQADMRSEVFRKLQRLPVSYYNDNKTGVIMSRIINDLNEISELAHHGPEDLFISIVMFVGSFLILIGINVELTLIVFSMLPIIYIYSLNKKRLMKSGFKESRVKTGEINATLENSISGMKVTKLFCIEDYEFEKFNNSNNKFKNTKEISYKKMASYYSGMYWITDMLELLVVILGGYFTYLNKINYGDFIAYILYIKLFMQPIRKLIMFTERFQDGMSGFERYLELINEDEEKESKNPIELKNVKGKIEINNVSFSYNNKNKVLDNLSLTIDENKTVALVGPSGGGKTTLCNLITRFFEYESGSIKIDGINIKDVSLKSLRENIGVVSQDVFLFTGTIKDNITIGKPNCSEEEMISACKKAMIHDFIISLPNGYNTYIGERGVKLSGGQKQRISIARIFLKNPQIIILDEATSALDNITESEIQKSLEKLSQNKTTLVIAHRLSTIQNADEIIVLADNQIKEKGNHLELLNKDGIYSKLYKNYK